MNPQSIPPFDEWGHDPQVRRLRAVFSRFESTQKRLFENLRVDPLDGRLRTIREKALDLFETARIKLQRRGMLLRENEFDSLYLMGLIDLCRSQGMHIPAGLLPPNEKIENLFKEITS